jgi:hypothetical protein
MKRAVLHYNLAKNPVTAIDKPSQREREPVLITVEQVEATRMWCLERDDLRSAPRSRSGARSRPFRACWSRPRASRERRPRPVRRHKRVSQVVHEISGEATADHKKLQNRKPSVGLEPTTPSLPWKCSTN